MDWDILEENCLNCTKCGLCKTRKNVVIGRGSRDTEIMFVGEAPGENEDIRGLPFVGKAGRLLEKYFKAVGIDSESVYITNILKCRPPLNRDPDEEEQNACIPYLREQYRLINPKIVVCLGKIAATKLIKPNFAITKEHGRFFNKGGVIFCAVYHPSALLRDVSKREDAFEDLLKIKAYIDTI